MDNKVAFSLSYEHLTRIAEKISWNASWTAMAINTSENQARPPLCWESGMNWPLTVHH